MWIRKENFGKRAPAEAPSSIGPCLYPLPNSSLWHDGSKGIKWGVRAKPLYTLCFSISAALRVKEIASIVNQNVHNQQGIWNLDYLCGFIWKIELLVMFVCIWLIKVIWDTKWIVVEWISGINERDNLMHACILPSKNKLQVWPCMRVPTIPIPFKPKISY